jgi:hypothetical protein
LTKAPWDFGYMPVPTGLGDDDGEGRDVVVALSAHCESAAILRAVEHLGSGISPQPLFSRPPIFWWRIRSSGGLKRAEIADKLSQTGIEVRYVASALRPSLFVPPRFRYAHDLRCKAARWPIRRGTTVLDPDSPGRWFLRSETGIAVDRTHFGAGSGTRLAVIDDDAAGISDLDLDAEVLINLEEAPRNTLHGAVMVALAVGTRYSDSDKRFQGVAPWSSPRLYCTPKPGEDVVSLALAIVRAVDDGADVIVCANYIEGTTSPMLDDALEFAIAFGRKGRGTAVIFPVGRETSSPENSAHASLSLAFSDPASDPRAFAIGPSGKDGGWFLWRDRKGRLRPFANRGPAVRWLAPGDDLAFPFDTSERLFHSESSGASAIAAGALLLLLGANPTLRLAEVDAIVTRTASAVLPFQAAPGPLADRHDVDPFGSDRDGHDAKHGYGRLHASRACLTGVDPLSAALVAIGQDDAAMRFVELRAADPLIRSAYSKAFALWMARALVADAALLHASKALARHLRAVANHPDRQRAHMAGSVVRQIVLVLRSARGSRMVPTCSKRVSEELDKLAHKLEAMLTGKVSDSAFYGALAPLWQTPS